MAEKGSASKKARLQSFLAERDPAIVDEALWRAAKELLKPVSDSYVRKLLMASGRPLSPEIEGVNQGSLADLERSLGTLASIYGTVDGRDRRKVRDIVIRAKDHARLALKRIRDSAKSSEREEMILWMRMWLDNPELFEHWVALRRRVVGESGLQPGGVYSNR